MDAHHKHPREKFVERLAVGALAALTLVGIWQCYGDWLIAAVTSRVG